MKSINDYEMKEFLEVLSSKEAVPGGGGASAYVAAIGMSLGTMVANLTNGKKKYADVQDEIEKLTKKAERITEELAEFVDKDAVCFEPLSKAYGLPKETDEEVKHRNEVMEAALVTASETPIELMSKILEAMKIIKRLSVIGSKLAISDAGVAILMARAGLHGASLNVYINTGMMKDKKMAHKLEQMADNMCEECDDIAEEVYDTVIDKIR